jgi:tetratricopeptide (TPR) repeat protein
MRGAVIAVLCGLFMAAAASGGVYTTGEQPLGPLADKDGVNPMPHDLFLSTLGDRIGLLADPSKLKFGDPPLPEATLKRRKEQEAKLATLQTKLRSGGATLDEQINASAMFISLGKYREAVELLEPLARGEGQRKFMVLSNLATSYELNGQPERVLDYLDFALSTWPEESPGISKEQLRFFREVEGYQKRLVRVRKAEAARQPPGVPFHPKSVDPLFGELDDPVRFVGESGQYEAGTMAAKEKGKLPKNAIPIVQQLALWMPNDSRLYWLLAELLNADGQITEARKIMDECVGPSRKLDPQELKEHRHLLMEWTPPKPQPPNVLPDTQKLFVVGGFIVLVVGMLGYFQLRELWRRRLARDGQ